ncbi:hypothetical protein ABZ319_01955 [Nocardia sp. NPDC005978]|uniref:hypothetical protein n=1 Tax=Nocardia sp. NPDC005978 TaxID=3156725 RepID=UPI0033BC9696
MITPIAVLGAGPIADRFAKNSDVVVTEPDSAAVVIHLTADAGEVVTQLRAGRDVVTALALRALPVDEVRAACRAGGSTLHATGGFGSAVAARLTRSLAAAAREITRIELIEEIDVPGDPVFPWNTVSEDTLPAFYADGLKVLHEAAFGDEPIESPSVAITDSGALHTLGDRTAYRSIRTHGTAAVPLRYRLTIATAAGTSTATVGFHPTDALHPADHLTYRELLTAIAPIQSAAPGIARRDLAITYLRADDRLSAPGPGHRG